MKAFIEGFMIGLCGSLIVGGIVSQNLSTISLGGLLVVVLWTSR